MKLSLEMRDIALMEYIQTDFFAYKHVEIFNQNTKCNISFLIILIIRQVAV